MQVDWTSVQAVILDLGGVILNIDYHLTINAFQALGFSNFEMQYSQLQQSGLFDDLETGRIDEAVFIERIKTTLPQVLDEEIIAAWNALLLDFPAGRIQTVQKIAARFPTYLLSNTNAIHYRAFNQTLRASTELDDIKTLFQHAYLSHEIGMRKPDREVFQFVIEQQGLNPEHTLFVDDSPQHVEAAKALGIQAYHLVHPENLEYLFRPILTEFQ